MYRRAQFNKVVIIESIAEGMTGRRLYEDLNTLASAKDHLVGIEYYFINTKKELFNLLETLWKRMPAEDMVPILHFECHGTDDKKGLALSNPKEFVSWAELKLPIQKINRTSRLNTIVCFAACYGAYFTTQLTPCEPTPCWALVGPCKEISSSALSTDFNGFYTAILDGQTGSACVAILNKSVSGNQPPYLFTTAEHFYDKAWENYINSLCTNEALNERANAMVRKYRARKLPKERRPSRNDMKNRLREYHPEYRKKTLRIFFMVDDYPEHWDRFELEKKVA